MDLWCKYPKPLFKTQSSEIIVQDHEGFDMKTGELTIDPADPYQIREEKKPTTQ